MCLVTSNSIPSPDPSARDEGLRKRSISSCTARTSSTLSESSSSSEDSSSHNTGNAESPSSGDVDIVASFENVDCDQIFKFYAKSGILWDFFNPRKPWVLVPNGSFMGYFDWVPLRFRCGPWHPACAVYLVILTVWVYHECSTGFAHDPFPEFQPVQAWNLAWYYNVAAFAWTSYTIYNILCTGMGWTSWGMYTVWSWTFTALRHGLCAVAPFKPEWNAWNEYIRFPMLVQATLTFAVWNAMIGPSIYAQMKTPAMKQSFCRFFGNSLWRQLHVYNILYAVLNGIWGSPGRSLTKSDFSVALAICMLYAYFYIVGLDRLGVHYYLVFSPRTPFALISWTLMFAAYYACFPMWNTVLTNYS